MNNQIGRRKLLGIGASAVAGSAISCARSAPNPWRFLSAAEGRTLNAVCAQLIPSDRDPGAREAGVVNYIDLQLSTRFKRHRKAYREGLARIAATGFADLNNDQQVAILKTIEEKDRIFFDLMLNHARQGFYGDPRHGGNRGMASWKMVGLTYPQVRGRQHYDEPKAG